MLAADMAIQREQALVLNRRQTNPRIPSQAMSKVLTTYLDFELEIGPARGRDYPVAVTHSPVGEAQATMRFPYDAMTLEKRLVVLQNALRGSGAESDQMLFPEELVVRDFGRDLFEALFTGEVRRLYEESTDQAKRENKGISLKLRFEPSDLAALPWEFLYEPRQAAYVCLSRTASLVRAAGLPGPLPSLRLGPPLRILAMIAGPGNLKPPDIARQQEQLETALRDLQAEGLAELTWLDGPTSSHLKRALRDGTWHAFHFFGQGSLPLGGARGDQPSDKGATAPANVEGDTPPLSAIDLPRLLADPRSLQIALLNTPAREGDVSPQEAASLRSAFTSTAALLVRGGIPAVLTMPYQITNQAAVELFRAFYGALATGMPVDVAVAHARTSVSTGIPNTVEWGVPTLYMGAPKRPVLSTREKLRTVPAPAQVVVEEPRPMGRPEQGVPLRASAPVAPPARKTVAQPARKTVAQPATKSVAQPATKSVAQPRVRRLQQEILIRSPQPIEPDMVLVAGGEFWMGSDPQQDQLAYEAEQPQQRVHLPDYHIARTPTTNAQYAAFVKASGHLPPSYWEDGKVPKGKEDYPVAYVSWYDAVAYCKWLSRKRSRVYRLPSEAEWEKAARGIDGEIYPWGDVWDPACCNSKDSGPDEPTLVHAYPDGGSPYGLLDMAGNVWEWTGSLTMPYPYDATDGREDPQAFGKRVLRGGAYYSTARRVRCAYRDNGYPEDSHGSYGFRVVLAPS
jgi:formylglycine-generating enzyme required for sulfatase activity